jgi:mono/diheme cytochrome c family protein
LTNNLGLKDDKGMKFLILAKLFLFVSIGFAQNWDKDYEVLSPRENIYQLSDDEFKKVVEEGKKIALFYPVTISDLLIPYQPLKTFFESDQQDPVRKLLFDLAKVVSPFKNMNEVYTWLGVHQFPQTVQTQTPNQLPDLTTIERELPMGATLIKTENGTGLTFGCAACHAADLFGVKVLGLTNRFPRANEFFRNGKQIAPYVDSFLFKAILGTTEGERLMMVQAKKATKWVGTKKPQALGLDTSLAQVALSLAKREQDGYATRTDQSAKSPRPNQLETLIADSKPAVWWNVKYKNRWLSDGSIISGNPVHTNFLWNEIGRGTDLYKLEDWLSKSEEQVKALTAAVFASKAPRYEKFFGRNSINIEKAMRGEKHFIQSCQKCHGVYEKAWSTPEANSMTNEQLLQTIKVTYHKKTPVIDVGTDPGRYLGMSAFADELNRLQISKNLNAVVVPQKGYVPPPLEGIWARFPYMHNNSIPSLCDLLKVGEKRVKTYWAVKAIDKGRDFDQDCVGYPGVSKIPSTLKKDLEYYFDTTKEGLSNKGHDQKIIIKDGIEVFTEIEKSELIEFLKTL